MRVRPSTASRGRLSAIWMLVLATLLAVLLAVANAATAAGYATSPLDDPPFDAEEVAKATAQLNNWLVENYPKLDLASRKGPREALFSLVSSHVAHLQAAYGTTFPTDADLLLQTIYSWAEPLGVHGGHLVFNELRSRQAEPTAPEMPAMLEMPSGFSIELEGDQLRLASKTGGWRVGLPYYFMVFGIDEVDTRNGGPRTQLVTLSTGAAPHEGVPGLSQSTLVIMAGPGQAGPAFQRFWERAQGFDLDAEREPLGIDDLRSVRRFDEERKIRSELVGWLGTNGPIVVAYSGVPGPFEKNRPHFLDFVRSLRAGSGHPPKP